MAKSRKLSTPAGISLDDLVKSLKAQDLKIPEGIQKLLDEQEAEKQKAAPVIKKRGKQRQPMAGDPAPPVTNPTLVREPPIAANNQPEAASTEPLPKQTPSQSFTPKDFKEEPKKPPKKGKNDIRNFIIKSIFGKNIAKKIEKSFPAQTMRSDSLFENVNKPKKGPSNQSKDIKQLKDDVSEIKLMLVRMVPEKKTRKEPSKMKGVLLKSLFGEKIGEALTRIGNNRSERTSKPSLKPIADRIPQARVAEAATEQIAREKSFSGTADESNKDQAAAASTKEELLMSEKDKKVNKKLDTIIELLRKIRKKGSDGSFGLSSLWPFLRKMMASVALIGATIKKVWSVLGNVWTKIKNFGGKLIEGAGKFARTIVENAPKAARIGAGILGAVAATAETVNIIGKQIPDAIMKKNLEPADKLEKQYGLKSGIKEGKIGQWSVDGGKTYVPYKELPTPYQRLIDANIGDKRTFSAKKAQEYIEKHPEEYKKLEVKPRSSVVPVEKKVPAPRVAPKPTTAPNRLSTSSQSNNEMRSQTKVVQPIVIRQKSGNKVVAVPQEGGNRVIVVKARNSEPSLDRYNGSIFDHPAGYYGIYRL